MIIHKPDFNPLSNKGWQYPCVCALMVTKQWRQKQAKQPTLEPFYNTFFLVVSK